MAGSKKTNLVKKSDFELMFGFNPIKNCLKGQERRRRIRKTKRYAKQS